MSGLTPAMEAALQAKKVLAFGLLRIDLPDYNLRVIAGGTGEVIWDGGTFLGRDPTFGALASFSDLDDAMDDEAPSLSIALLPPSSSAAAELCNPDMQGSRVRLWLASMVRATGAVVADPYLLFDGIIDQPTLTVGRDMREVEFECISAMDLFFDNDEGFRLSDANHQRVWPSERGLEHMTALPKQIYWGIAKPGMSGGGGGEWGSGGGRGEFLDPRNISLL